MVTWRPATADGTDTLPVSDGRRRLLHRVCLSPLAAPAVLAGCANVQWFDRPTPTPTCYQPPLYRINPPAGYRGAAWLLGTVHAGQHDLLPLPAAVTDRFDAADMLAVELDIPRRRSQLHAEFSARALLPDNQRLNQYLSEPTIAWLRRRFLISDDRWPGLARLQPWALTRALHGSDRSAPALPTHRLEQILLDLAQKRRKPVHELERPGEQVRALAGGSLAWQAQLLEFRVKDGRFWDNSLNRLIRAWRAGDQEQILSVKQAAFGVDALREPLRLRLFANRDKRMSQRLLNLLREPIGVFAAVGTFHLVGRNSMIERINQLGMRVERVNYQVSTRFS